MMKKHTLPTLATMTTAALLTLAPLHAATAEELKVSVKEWAQRSLQEQLPRNGMSESSVRNGWGQPESVTGPVGEPPIHQWHYQDFVVYFEGNRVIHAVLKQD